MKKMKKEKVPLKVLYLEDSPNDIELIRELLIEAGYELSLDTTERREEFTTLLRNNSYDIILSDFTLPGFNAFGALELSMDICPDTPFICISGSIGEETAIELIKKGAVDYVLKDRTARLPFAIERALEITKEAELRKHAEKDLQKSELRFHTLAVMSTVGIFQTDIDGSTIYVNPKWCQISGLSLEESLGYGWLKAVHPTDKDMLIKEWQESTKLQKSSYRDYRFLHKDGTITWVMGQAVPEKNSENQIIGYIGTITDITERKLMEESLRENERQISIIYDTVGDNIFNLKVEKNGNYVFTSVNQCFLTTTGLRADQIIGKRVDDIIPEPSLTFALEKYAEAIREKKIVRWEETSAYPTGKLVGAVSIAPVFDDSNNCVGLVGSVHDITDRKEAEEALRHSEQRYKLMLESITDYSYSVEIQNSRPVKTVHGFGCEKVTGYTPMDYLVNPKLWLQMVYPDDQKIVEHYADPLSEGKEVPPLEHRLVHKNGSVIWVRNTYVLKHDTSGKVTGFDGLISDITERKQAEKALQRSEEQYRMLFSQMTNGFALHEIILDDKKHPVDYRFLQVNKAFEQLTGLRAETIIGKTVLEVLPKTEPPFIQRYGEVALSGEDIQFESYSQEFNKYYSIRAYAPEHGKFATIFEDITERKLAEEKLSKSEEKYRSIFENVQDVYYEASMDGTIIEISPSIEVVSKGEYRREDLIGKSMYDFYSITGGRQVLLTLLHERGSVSDYEIILINRDGSKVPCSISAKIQFDNQGNASKIIGSLRNITARKRAEDELRKLSSAVQQSPASINITDTLGNIEYVNPKVTEITGYNRDELIGKNPRLWSSGDTSSVNYKILWDTITSGKEWQGEFQNKKKNGELFWESASISPIKDENGNITHFLAVKEDITEKKRMLFELIEAKDRAEELNRLKSNFMANMSHELRTPLVGFIGISELMKEELEGENKENATIIYESGLRLLKTLTEILEFSKIESEKTVVNLSVINLTQLLVDEIKLYQITASQKGISIMEYFSMDDVPIETDEKMLREIIDNLINNAVKFTPTGKVTISLEQIENEILIKIADTGIGIPKDKLDIIFEEFRQVSEGMSRNFEGSGLGLTIVKKYINLLNGSIDVESELDIGSTFTVHLPFTHIEKKNIEVPEQRSLQDVVGALRNNKLYKVLIVEDDYMNSFTIMKMLKNDYDVIWVQSGQKAIEVVSNQIIDIILMDINLRFGLNGIETTQLIRKIPGYENTPIVAVTAYATPSDKEEFLHSGCSHYLAKPFPKNVILQLLKEILSEQND